MGGDETVATRVHRVDPRRPLHGAEIALEPVEQVEEADRFPRPVSLADRDLVQDTGALEAKDRLARLFRGGAQQTRGRGDVEERMRRQQLDEPACA